MENYKDDLKLFFILGIIIGLIALFGFHTSGRDMLLIILSYVVIGGGAIMENKIKDLENKVNSLEKHIKS